MPENDSPLSPVAPPPVLPSVPSGKKRGFKIAGLVLGVIVGGIALKLLHPGLGSKILGNGLIGLIAGLVPFAIGWKRYPRLARASLWTCLIAGMVLGLVLALPVAALFACFLLAKKINEPPAAPPKFDSAGGMSPPAAS